MTKEGTRVSGSLVGALVPGAPPRPRPSPNPHGVKTDGSSSLSLAGRLLLGVRLPGLLLSLQLERELE